MTGAHHGRNHNASKNILEQVSWSAMKQKPYHYIQLREEKDKMLKGKKPTLLKFSHSEISFTAKCVTCCINSSVFQFCTQNELWVT